MRIAVAYLGSMQSSWNVSDGLPRTLKAMGHDVTDWHQLRPRSKPLDASKISAHDLVIFSGPEWQFSSDLIASREFLSKITCPKFAIYHENMLRQDRTFPFPQLLDSFDEHFYPAIQDADAMDRKAPGRCHFLPFGVDLEVFHPRYCKTCRGKKAQADGTLCFDCKASGYDDSNRDIAIGFIGTVYGKRKSFIERLGQLYTPQEPFQIGSAGVTDIEGFHPLHSAYRLAANYQRILLFANLPVLSQLMVTKCAEAAACGCCLITPWLEGQAERNMNGWDNGETCMFYKGNDPASLNAVFVSLLKEPERAVKIGRRAAELMREKFSLRDRMEFVLSKVATPAAISA